MNGRIVCWIAALVLVTGCQQFVKRDEFLQTTGELRRADDALGARIDDVRYQFDEMTGQLHTKFRDYDATITEFQGRLRIDMTAHFATNDSIVRDEDKLGLDRFSEVVGEHHQNVTVTVEGFTDPSGSPEYNKWLGLERAKAVRAYLVNAGGLDPDRVRAVSYGEDAQRLVAPNQTGEAGLANRRVALVIDYIAETSN